MTWFYNRSWCFFKDKICNGQVRSYFMLGSMRRGWAIPLFRYR